MKYLCSSLSVLTFHFTLLKYAILLWVNDKTAASR